MEDIPVDAYEQDAFRPFEDDGIPEPAFVSPAPRPAVQPRPQAPRAFSAPAPAPHASAPVPEFKRPAQTFQPPKKPDEQERRAFVPSVQKPAFSPKSLTDNGKTAETQAAPRRESADWKNIPVDASLAWDAFLASCEGNADIPIPMLRQLSGEVRGDWLVLLPFSQVVGQQMQRPEKLRALEALAAKWAGRPLQPVFRAPQKIVRTEAEIREEMSQHPVVKHLQEAFDAMLVRCTPSR